MAPPITCECGACHKCKRRVYMRDYYRRNAPKLREATKASRLRRIESVREYDRARDAAKVHDKTKERARMVIAHLVEGGFQRPSCEVCGKSNAEAHHTDYSRPLDVRWLCRSHHMELHRSVAA